MLAAGRTVLGHTLSGENAQAQLCIKSIYLSFHINFGTWGFWGPGLVPKSRMKSYVCLLNLTSLSTSVV